MALRVSVIGATCWGNRGAEAMLATSIGIMRQRHPDARFNVMSYYPARDRELIRDPAVKVFDARPSALVLQHLPFSLCDRVLRPAGLRLPRALMPASVQALRDSDVLVDLGGISFSDGRAIFLPFNILCVYPAMLLGVPVVKLAQAMGPFNDWPTKLAARLFLTRCAHVVARGPRTLQHLRAIGIAPDRCSLAADVAFGYQPSFSLSDEHAGSVKTVVDHVDELRARGERVVGLSPSTVVWDKFSRRGRDYVQFMTDLAAELVGRGWDPLESTCRHASLSIL